MKYDPEIHSKSFLIKSILGKIESAISNIAKNRNDILVLNYHGVQKPFLDNFEWQIRFLTQHFDAITPEYFEKLFDQKETFTSGKPRFLLTFDDGILNNLNAVNILDKYNLKAYFFIIPDFVESNTPKDFFLQNIRPHINSNIDSLEEDFCPLSWIDLKELINQGHSIGAHTSSHTMTKNSSPEELQYEIIRAKNKLEENLSFNIHTFCSINNTFESVNKNAIQLIKKHYNFHFTTIAGKNIPLQPYGIKRINVESHWPENAFKYAIGKWEQKRWKNKVIQLNELIGD